MKEIDSKMLNEVRNNPLAQVLFGAMGITDKELDKLDEELKKKENSEVEEQSECENSSCDNLKKNNNEHNSTLTKEEVLAILKEWESVEKEVYRLDKEFGINIWDSDDESIYNKYNKIIRMFLDSQFGVEAADILEDWVFGYDKDNRPNFDDVWYNIIND